MKKTKALFSPEDYFNPKDKFEEETLGGMVAKYLSQSNYNRSVERSKERRENLRFYPSSLALPDRDIVLSMLGYVGKPQNGDQIMVMENGTSFHNRMEAMFEDMGIMIAPELSLKDPELKVSGRSDAIIWSPFYEEGEPDGKIIKLENPAGDLIYEGPENRVCLVEFKSINENGFYGLRKSKPKDAHEEQLQLYFYLTGITKGIVYYENKNNQRNTEYIIDRDEEVIKRVTKRIKYLLKCAENHEIPEPEHLPTDIFTQFSSYKDMTYPNTNPVTYDMLFNDSDNNDDVPF